MTASAPVTCNVPPELVTVPPSATARASARNRTEPVTPSWSPETPSSAIVAASGLDTVVRCGLSNFAVNEIAPGPVRGQPHRDHLVGALAITSRRKRTPFGDELTPATAVSRSRLAAVLRRRSAAAGNDNRRLPTGW